MNALLQNISTRDGAMYAVGGLVAGLVLGKAASIACRNFFQWAVLQENANPEALELEKAGKIGDFFGASIIMLCMNSEWSESHAPLSIFFNTGVIASCILWDAYHSKTSTQQRVSSVLASGLTSLSGAYLLHPLIGFGLGAAVANEFLKEAKDE